MRRLRHAGGDRGGGRALRHACRWRELAAPAIALARDGVEVNATQALLWELLGPIAVATPESRARYCVDGRMPREGEMVRDPELADGIERLAADGAAPFYTGRHRRPRSRTG